MERKLVKQGRNALTVTLPAQWLKAKGLKAGNSVFISEDNNRLLLATNAAAAESKIELDLRDAEGTMLYHVINGKYVEGYDVITILHNNQKQVREISRTSIGMILEEQTATRAVLRSIIKVPEDNFQAVLRRAGHLFEQQAEALLLLAQGKASFDDVKSQEELLDQNLLYCLRYLHKYESQKRSYREFMICSTLELAADQMTRIARHIGKNVTLAKIIHANIHKYVQCLFTRDFKSTYSSLRLFRTTLNTKSFVDGLAYTLAEILYNYIGYIFAERQA
jgi:antitoxin component of MazEF toxin-antitoxin module